ncbi:hypothetical protein HOLleu_10318 [Holothuria leucospilota]|uniref:Uncharacterized protein n=1 Tax=Holothuria leucospilota TaxID=206669 RepID=A0A9Q1CEZ7_HOLLE|nr:hypothetical protein HOLleu_10318 [Holothuria leucospilota]
MADARPRGRPPGSKNKKKDELPLSQPSVTPFQLRPSRSLTQLPALEYESSEGDVAVSTGLQSLDLAIQNITTELQNIRSEFAKSIEEHAKLISSLQEKNVKLAKKVDELKKRQKDQEQLLNKQERHSRRNNFRIVGIKQEKDEDCLKIASGILCKMGFPDPKLERAHRDGRAVEGRDRHILVKLSFFQDKVKVMKNARRLLEGENFYITDDLTKKDLSEKRRWRDQVSDLYRQGTRLHFSGGYWRDSTGKPFNFHHE